MPVHVLAVPLPIRRPVNAPWKAVEESPHTQGPTTCVGGPKGVPGYCLLPGSGTDIADIWEGN